MIPTLLTSRLTLRPFTLDDAPTVQILAGNEQVSLTTLNIPFPYPDGEAERWIGSHLAEYETQRGITLAIIRLFDNALVGAISLQDLTPEKEAEIGYWVGQPHWGQGYATEAAIELVRFAFEELNLKIIKGRHLSRNPASGKVLAKIGMKVTGVIHEHRWKSGKESVKLYGMMKKTDAKFSERAIEYLNSQFKEILEVAPSALPIPANYEEIIHALQARADLHCGYVVQSDFDIVAKECNTDGTKIFHILGNMHPFLEMRPYIDGVEQPKEMIGKAIRDVMHKNPEGIERAKTIEIRWVPVA